MLVFYPLDFSPVCTDQLNVYQEVLGELEEQGATLLGVSVDSAFAHKAFQDHLGVTIPLLADFHPKGAVAQRLRRVHRGARAQRAGARDGRPGGHGRVVARSPTPLEIPGVNLIFDALDQQRAA